MHYNPINRLIIPLIVPILTAATLSMTAVHHSHAQNTTSLANPFAYFDSTGNLRLADTKTGTTVLITAVNGDFANPFNTPETILRNIRWSPDGTKLLFVDASKNDLYLLESDSAPRVVATQLNSLFPPAWSPDGTQFAYVTAPTDQHAVPSSANPLDAMKKSFLIRSQRITGESTGHVPILIAEGCTADTDELQDPGAILYRRYVGYTADPTVLEWLPTGFMYTTSCTGLGVEIAAAGGVVIKLPGVIAPVQVSGSRIAYMQIVDSGEQVLMLGSVPENGASVMDNPITSMSLVQYSVQYSAVTVSRDGRALLYAVGDSKQTEVATNAVASALPTGALRATTYNFNVSGIALSVGDANIIPPIPLFFGAGYRVVSLSVASDDKSVLISFIPTSEKLIDALNRGATLTQADYPTPSIIEVPLPLDTIVNPSNGVMIGGGGTPAGYAGFGAVYAPVPVVFGALGIQ